MHGNIPACPKHLSGMRMLATLVLGAIGFAAAAGCDDKARIIVVHADSLSGPFSEVKKVFEAEHPGVRVDLEPFGSVLACRKLQAGVPCDVIAPGGPASVRRTSGAQKTGDLEHRLCHDRGIVIIKSSKSRYNTEITPDNWFEILTRPDVKVGAADPTLDPCGYWTRLMWELADRHYDPTGAGAKKGEGRHNCEPPQVAARMAAKCSAEFTRPDSQQLISLVEGSGGWDYAFVYKAQAEQQRLSYVPLPPEINLGSLAPAHVKGYSRAKLTVAGTDIVRVGEPLVFGISIPTSAREPALAEAFIAFVLSDRGKAICRQAGMPMLDKPISREQAMLPNSLRSMVHAVPE